MNQTFFFPSIARTIFSPKYLASTFFFNSLMDRLDIKWAVPYHLVVSQTHPLHEVRKAFDLWNILVSCKKIQYLMVPWLQYFLRNMDQKRLNTVSTFRNRAPWSVMISYSFGLQQFYCVAEFKLLKHGCYFSKFTNSMLLIYDIPSFNTYDIYVPEAINIAFLPYSLLHFGKWYFSN